MLTERIRRLGMSFCAACGRERAGANHYCNGCGAEFGEPADRAQTVRDPWTGGSGAPWPSEGSAGSAGQPASGTVTRPDLGIGLLDSLLAPPDPSWDDWYVHPARPAAEERRPVSRPVSRPPRWRKRIIVAVAATVMAVAVSGAAAFELGHGHARPGARAARSGGASAHSRTSVALGAVGDVAVAPSAAGSAALPQVTALLRRYFSAINAHDYAAYAQLLDAQVLVRTPASAFDSGYGSTTDSGEMLTGVSPTDSGGLAAAVTFTSRQQPSDSPDHSACDNWSITLYLVPDGAGYLIGLPPAGYQASYTSC